MSLANVPSPFRAKLKSQWRQFSFFNTKALSENDADSDKAKTFQVPPYYFVVDIQNPDITTICASAGNVLVGDNQGHIRILSKSWNVVMTFTAYEGGRVTHMIRIKKSSLLLTIGV